MGMIIRDATEADLEAINAIYNDEILHGTATWDVEPWTLEKREKWFAKHGDETTPVLVAEYHGDIAGFAYLSPYRSKAGYRYTRESTIYLAKHFRGRGLGTPLLSALIQRARAAGLHTLIGVITSDNEASLQLHAKLGFEQAGMKPECGFKFGRWLDEIDVVKRLDD